MSAEQAYIFLDIDGVLAPYNRPDGTSFDLYPHRLDPYCMDRINEVTRATGAKVILASAWHRDTDMQILKDSGLEAEIIGSCGTGGRGEHITRYLQSHPEIKNFIVIEDEWGVFDRTPELIHRVICVKDKYKGMQEFSVQQAVERLQGVPYRWKVLCVRQPWAWLLIHGGKDVENRSWKTTYRGPLLICASKGCTKTEYQEAKFWCAYKGIIVPSYQELDRGGIIGMVHLYDCANKYEYPTRWHLRKEREGDLIMSPWYMGDVAWCVRNPQSLPFTPIKGQLGIFEVDYEFPLRGSGNSGDR